MGYVKNLNTRELYYNDKVLLCNIKNGSYLRVNKFYYQYLEELLIYNEGSFEKVKIEDEEIDTNIHYLLQELIKIKYYILPEQLEEERKESYEVIYLSLTNECNLRCKHCSAAKENDKNEELSIDSWKKILHQVIELKPKVIEITGGEPLLYEHFNELISYLRSIYKGCISLSTNALLIDEDNIKNLTNNIDNFSISLDGFDDESCSYIRGAGIFDKVIKKILYLQEAGIRNIEMSMLVTAYTQESKDKFKELCNQLDVTPIYRRFAPTGRGEKNCEDLIPKKSVFCDISADSLQCGLCKPGKRELNICSNGDVYPCAPLSTISKLKMGNAIKETLSVIIQNNRVEDFIDKLRPWNTELCRECNINLFCHSCINYMVGIKNDPKIFQMICEQNRKIISKLVWE